MKTWVLLLGCLLALSSQAQTRREVYQWRDADGVTHFSDYPQPGARKIVLNGAPTTTTATPPTSAAAAARPAPPPAPAEVTYSSLEIQSPANEEAFFDADAIVNIRVHSNPALAPTHQLLTYLDGRLLTGEGTGEYNVSNLPRGAHSIASAIVDPTGRELIRSATVTFFMKQTSVANPRSQGPAVRPPQPRRGG
jgi:Domain of unknown function (DUF4124)